MNERERLIGLIGSKVCENYSPSCDENTTHSCEQCYANNCKIGDIADYLLENGVVALPCNLRLPDEMYRHMFDDKNTKIVIKCKVVKITGYGFTLRHIDGREWDYGYNRIGKTVFFTKKEAEKAIEALKGGNEK